uniref:Uncharacterized protein n=1 Tax=Anguilla anguilla TaxID=7936 RepID=A0A0E9S7B0_ANGAN
MGETLRPVCIILFSLLNIHGTPFIAFFFAGFRNWYLVYYEN